MKATPLYLVVALTPAIGCGDSALETTTTTTTTAEGGVVSLPSGASDIVVNELSAVGASEWLEIANKGADGFDLGGYALADSDKSTGAPKTGNAMRFPVGTVLAAGAKLLVMLSKTDLPVGPHAKAECLPNGPDTCLYATWGLSAANGESVHFLAKDDAVIVSTAYPRNLGIDSANGQTACRLPDQTGELATCTGTPGSANVAP